MTEKRPSWKDILWTPVYDFMDKRWGIWGLRLFAISIALFPAALLFFGWIQNREQMPGGDDQLVIAWLGGADRDPRRVVDLFDAVPVDRVALTEAFQGYAAPEASPAREDFRTWKSELDARFGEYVKDVRRYIGVAGAAWSESITTVVGPFRGDWFEELLERIGRRAS